MREGLSRLSPALVLIAFCLPLFIGLGSTDLDNDEAIYSFAVESILTTGDWLAPRSSPSWDDVFLEKPHLKLWLVALPIRLGLLPLNEFGLRFWDALFGAAAFVYVFLIGRTMNGTACGVTAVLVLFVHAPLMFDHGFRSNNMDAAVVAAYCGGIYHYVRWSEGASRALHIGAIGAWFYVAFMAKFVAAIFLPGVLGVCALLIPAHRARLVADRKAWVMTTAAVIAAATPWFIYQHLRHGAAFWKVLLGEHVVTRFTSYVDPAHLRPWHFYFTEGYRHLARSGSGPWVVFGLVVLCVETVRRRLPAGWLVLAWAVLPLVAISFGSSKLYHYAYPFIPPFALAAGYGVGSLVTVLRRLVSDAAALRVRAAIPTPLRISALAVLFAAVILMVATGVTGTLQVYAGEQLLFRNSSLLRPGVVAVICAALAMDVRVALAGAMILVLSPFVSTPVAAYGQSLRTIGTERRPLGQLRDCLGAIDGARAERGASHGAYAPVGRDFYLHQYFFYFRGTGWMPARPDDGELRSALFAPGQERPVVIDNAAYADFLEGAGQGSRLPPAVERPNIVVLLPGEYRACRGVDGPARR